MRKSGGLMGRLLPGVILIVLLAGCIVEYSPPESINLIDVLPGTQSSLDLFSYDLTSSLLLPFYTAPGPDITALNIASRYQDVTFAVPMPGITPEALAVEARTLQSGSGRSDIRVYLNDEDIGLMIVKPTFRRKTLSIPETEWNPIINVLKFRTDNPDVHIQINNLWLLPDPNRDLSTLPTGNRFTGYVLVADDELMDAVYLPAGTSISFPVQIPEPSGFFTAQIRMAAPGHTRLDMALITAKVFKREAPMNFSFPVNGNGKEWAPLEWNLSDRAARHAILRLTNTGNQAIFVGEPEIVSRSSQTYMAAVTARI